MPGKEMLSLASSLSAKEPQSLRVRESQELPCVLAPEWRALFILYLLVIHERLTLHMVTIRAVSCRSSRARRQAMGVCLWETQAASRALVYLTVHSCSSQEWQALAART